MSDILVGHVLDRLAEMEPESVSCVVTSPPYWSLRSYPGADVVWGGADWCEKHDWATAPEKVGGAQAQGATSQRAGRANVEEQRTAGLPQGQFCMRFHQAEGDFAKHQCGAWRGQYGLEPTPELYVEHTLTVLRAIRRVLRPDGVVWWNIAGGYNSVGGTVGGAKYAENNHQRERQGSRKVLAPALKPKDMDLMPFRIALAAQADGWYVRSVVIWAKPNAMPESVTDRPTTAHEYVLMLTKSARYWYDADAVREGLAPSSAPRVEYGWNGRPDTDGEAPEILPTERMGERWAPSAGRNLRSVWTFPTAQTPEAHFAVFPPELPRRCIEASCPREVCVRCGEASVRVVERRGLEEHPARANRNVRNVADYDGDGYAERESTLGLVADDVTVGWTSCDCAEPDYQPGLVLDPFAGVGTTGYVALQLGRRFAGIELSEKYAEIARLKLATWWKPGKITEPEVPEGQAALW